MDKDQVTGGNTVDRLFDKCHKVTMGFILLVVDHMEIDKTRLSSQWSSDQNFVKL